LDTITAVAYNRKHKLSVVFYMFR